MQPLQNTTLRGTAPDRCARDVLEGVPAVMRFLRHHMRAHRQAGLTVPQFRAMVFAHHGEERSLSAMAEHIGLSLPAASRMVDLLVRRGLLRRETQPGDRRRIALSLTRRGDGAFRAAFAATRLGLGRALRRLPPRELEEISKAMRILSRVFAPGNHRTDGIKGEPRRRARTASGGHGVT